MLMIFKRFFSSRKVKVLLVPMMALILTLGIASSDIEAAGIRLVIDGVEVTSSPQPVIKNGRTLIPVRLVSESLKAQVEWLEAERNVIIAKGERFVRLRIDNRLVDYQADGAVLGVTDVPPQIIDNRTFVPLRLISNALGVEVKWDDASRTVYVNSSLPPEETQTFAVTIPNIQTGQAITGAQELRASFSGTLPSDATEIRFFLLDPGTGKGVVIARGSELTSSYRWLPDTTKQGRQVLAASLYDKSGNFLAGCAYPVNMAVTPQVSLTGIVNGQTVADTVSIRSNTNFLAEYIKYEFTNHKTGKITITDEVDPDGPYQWSPEPADNAATNVRTIAYDSLGRAFNSPSVSLSVEVPKKQEFRGVSAGSTINKPVTLWVWRNYPVTMTEYLLKNTATGQTEIIAPADGYSGSTWFPGPAQAGTWELSARVKDTAGNTHLTESVTVNVTNTPKLLLQTVGPNQVLTDAVKLKSIANVELGSIEYLLINPQTGAKRVIASGNDSSAEYSYTPTSADGGNWLIQATGRTNAGQVINSETIPIRFYLGTIFPAKPLMEKNSFLSFVSQLAVKSQQKTGMSAALQAAQAILETGWGQSTPVDKYTGKLSNNIFGIKGQGSAGSVTSNTWEEYNGNTFRVDAAFRAYQQAEDSWDDHKDLLLLKDRYAPFREVMNDYTLGAWALRRCGYATDSKYPLKLINIIKQYNLYPLDEVSM